MKSLSEKLDAIVADHYHANEEGMRIIRADEVCKFRGDSKSPFYVDQQKGCYPRGIKLGPQSVGWMMAEARVMQRARIAECSDDELRTLTTWLHEQRRIKARAA